MVTVLPSTTVGTSPLNSLRVKVSSLISTSFIKSLTLCDIPKLATNKQQTKSNFLGMIEEYISYKITFFGNLNIDFIGFYDFYSTFVELILNM
jgi:hypothetical protein